MLALVIIIPLQISIIVCFFCLSKREKVYAFLLAVAFLIGCTLIGLIVYDINNNSSSFYYTYEISVDSKSLESFFVDFDTRQQYEEWLCPDEQTETIDYLLNPILAMHKMIELDSPYDKVIVTLLYYDEDQKDGSTATGYFGSTSSHTVHNKLFRPVVKINADYEYVIRNAAADKEYNGFWYERISDYSASVMIRYKNCIFRFTEEMDKKKESRLGEAIDLLWADYEQYKEEKLALEQAAP